MADLPQPGYNRNDGPVIEGDRDAVNTRRAFEEQGPDVAASRIRKEVDSILNSNATTEEKETYFKRYKEGLDGTKGGPNILPELSIAFGLYEKDRLFTSTGKRNLWLTGSENVVDPTKVRSEANRYGNQGNVLYQELVREFGSRFEKIKSENAVNYDDREGYGQKLRLPWMNTYVPEAQLKDKLQEDTRSAENRKAMSVLITHPELFKKIAETHGVDNEITKEEVNTFREKWESDRNLRKELSKNDPIMERRIGNALEVLQNAWSSDNYANNYNNKRGSVLKDHLSNDNMYNWYKIDWFAKDGTVTEASILNGLGYKDLKDAKERTPVLEESRTGKAGEKPLAGVTKLDNFDNTKLLGPNDGPFHVAQRMLKGQEEFFKEPGAFKKAHEDLMHAIGVKVGIHNEKQGSRQVNENNIQDVIKNINDRKNPQLRDWLISRYPGAGEKPASRVEAAGNYNDTRVTAQHSPKEVADNMLRGSELAKDKRAINALTNVLTQEMKGVTRVGVPLIREDNLEDVRKKIEAKEYAALTQWFNRRYPPRDKR